jgi:glycerol-3-phosphate cytidylyltransferase-like family protein
MDSRNKILTLEEALALRPVRPFTVVTGLLDLLRAAHVRALQDVRRQTRAATLMAVVLPHPDAVLGQRERAEMAAALRVLDYVVTADVADLDRIAAALQPDAVARLEDADAARVRELIAHVQSRQIR